MIRKALWFAWIVAAASDKKVVCPEDANVFGYDSIDALNQDMKAIFETGEHLGTRSHVFRLCPHTIFDGSQRLTPLLNNSHFVCGYDGDPTHKCTISGGKHQIYIADYPGSSMEYISFRGITLSDSEEFGVAAQSRSGVVADFFDCQWVDGHGVSGVHIVYEAYAENTDVGEADEEVLYPEIAALSPEENNETIDNVFAHRELSTIADSGMTVRIYNSTLMDV
ncbi:hypothetical protein MHU86_9175 [Fragilaria crotonensis]|nr:hypothetical protein MHU86_9175 [Fragilaria crotonensis]